MTATTATTAPKKTEMRFYNPTEKDMVVSLTSGHTAHIPPKNQAPDGVVLERRFHKAALAEGALPEGYEEPEEDEANNAPTRPQVIEAALLGMVKGNEKDDFKTDGTPNINALQRRCGFRVTREEVIPVWQKVQTDLDAAEKAGA